MMPSPPTESEVLMKKKHIPSLLVAPLYLLMALTYAGDALWYHWQFYLFLEAGEVPFAPGFVGMVFCLFALAALTLIPAVVAVISFFCNRGMFHDLLSIFALLSLVFNAFCVYLVVLPGGGKSEGDWILNCLVLLAFLSSLICFALCRHFAYFIRALREKIKDKKTTPSKTHQRSTVMNRKELKANARAQIKGKIGLLFAVTFLIGLISGAAEAILGLIPGGSLVGSIIITPAFTLSTINIYLMVVRGDNPEIGQIFSGFDDFFSAFKVTFLVGLYTFLWSLLFFIPGIIKAYSYSMSMYILADNKGKGARECIAESIEMTNGHKWELFVLNLSFIGWILLAPFTLGILLIWLAPYMNATMANAYEALKPVPVVYVPIEEEPAATEATTPDAQ